MERVIEIVNFVMKQVLDQGETHCSEKKLIEELMVLGYSTDEIKLAFKLIYSISDNLKSDPESMGSSVSIRHGHRVFSPDEQKKLSVSFQGELLRLTGLQLISSEEAEKVLIEAMQSDSAEIGLKELDLILHKVINDEERLLMINPQFMTQMPSILIN